MLRNLRVEKYGGRSLRLRRCPPVSLVRGHEQAQTVERNEPSLSKHGARRMRSALSPLYVLIAEYTLLLKMVPTEPTDGGPWKQKCRQIDSFQKLVPPGASRQRDGWMGASRQMKNKLSKQATGQYLG